MAIYPLLQNSTMGPEEIAVLAEAYELTLKKLDLVDRSDPITQIVAKKIIEMGQRGVRDPEQLSSLALKELRAECSAVRSGAQVYLQGLWQAGRRCQAAVRTCRYGDGLTSHHITKGGAGGAWTS
jgi:hypothetical protein